MVTFQCTTLCVVKWGFFPIRLNHTSSSRHCAVFCWFLNNLGSIFWILKPTVMKITCFCCISFWKPVLTNSVQFILFILCKYMLKSWIWIFILSYLSDRYPLIYICLIAFILCLGWSAWHGKPWTDHHFQLNMQ